MIVVNKLRMSEVANSHHLNWPLVWFVVALPAAPAPSCGPGRTGRRPLSAGHTLSTAGSSQEPSDEIHDAYNDILCSLYFDIRSGQFKDTEGKTLIFL